MRQDPNNRTGRLSIVLWLAFASGAIADDSLVNSVTDCRALASADDRLACYDKSVDEFATRAAAPARAAEADPAGSAAVSAAAAVETTAPAAAAETVAAAAATEAEAPAGAEETDASSQTFTTEEVFGLPPAAITPDQIDEIEATIVELSPTASGKVAVLLDNGQLWRQTSSSNLRLKEGDVVEIERASMGSHKLSKADTRRTMKVKRVR